MPATVNAGDLLLMFFAADGTGTHTTPAGWTLRGSANNTAAAVRSSVYEKVAVGTEGGTTVNVTMSLSGNPMSLVARYQAGTFTAGVANAQSVVNAVASQAAPNLTPAWGALNTGWIIWAMNFNSTAISSYPAPNNNASHAGGGTLQDAFSTRDQNTATLTGGTVTWAGSTYGTIHKIGIRPI